MAVNDAPTRPIGTLGDGTGPYGRLYTDLIEHVPDLWYPDSVRTYGKMRTDAALKSVLAAYINPMRSAPFYVNPDGASDRTVRALTDSLGLPLQGEDTPPGRDRNRGVSWTHHIRLAALSLVYGHYGFEPVYRVEGTGSDARAVLAALPERKPDTIDTIHVDDDTGALLGITQKRNARSRAGNTEPKIPADRLVWYVNDREGSAWWGQSILRAAFGPWLLKQETLRVHATTLRRFGAGTPVMEPLPGHTPTPAEIVQAQRAASSVRVGDSGGLATPGFRLRILGIEGRIPDGIPFLRYLDEQMARQALFSLLDLSGSPNGSRALGDTFLDVLTMALQAVADDLAATATEQIARPLTDYNDGEGAPVPAIEVGPVVAKDELVAASVGQLLASGALTHDPELEGWLRRTLGLPQRAAGGPPVTAVGAGGVAAAGRRLAAHRRAREREAIAGRVAAADASTATSTTTTATTSSGTASTGTTSSDAWPYRRALTDIEAAAALDPTAIDTAYTSIETTALTAWTAAAAALRDQLVADIEAAVDAGDLIGLATLTVDTSQAEDVFEAAATTAADQGITLAVDEADTAGVTLTPPDAPDVSGWARSVAAVVVTGLALSAGKEALRLAGPDVPAADVAAGVRVFLDSLTDAAVREALGGVITGGISAGRLAAVASGPTARYYHSAILDKATCDACAAADGQEYPTLADAEAAFPAGPYRDCQGRWRCRCVIATVWGDT